MTARVLLALAIAGCFRPALDDGEFTCSVADPRCPEGFSCDPCDQVCRREPRVRRRADVG